MKNISLRPYQQDCYDAIAENFKTKSRQLISLPTGAGKTVIFTKYIKDHCKKALIVCPTIDLQEQLYKTFLLFFDSSNVSTSIKKSGDILILVAASLRYKGIRSHLLEKYKFDLIVFDEAHKAHCKTYLDFLSIYSNVNKEFNLLGVTATPERHDKRPLLQIFDSLTYSISIIDLVKQNFLCELNAYRITTNQYISSNHVKNGDFSRDIFKILDNDSRNSIILKTYEGNCVGKKTLIFCLSIDHAEKMSNVLKSKGFKSAFIHGLLKPEKRKKIIDDFKKGDIEVLTNCQLLTEGFDEPSINALIIARPTRSKSLYCQMVGRGLRLSPGKNHCDIYELTDNSYKICTFDVLCDKEPTNSPIPIKAGTTLLERHKELISLNTNDLNIEMKPLDLMGEISNNAYDILYDLPSYENQKQRLKELNIKTPCEPNFLEAAFLIWKQNLRMKYGYN